MARQISRVASILIREHFGAPAQQVSDCLLQRGMCTLREVLAETGLGSAAVKRLLCILIQHDIVTYNDDSKFALFSVNLQRAYLIARYPRFLSLVREESGATAELILSQLLIHGSCSIEELVESISSGPETPDIERLKELFLSMMEKRYVAKVRQQAEVIEELEARVGEEREGRTVSGGIKRSVITAEVAESKRQKLEEVRARCPNEKQAGLWGVNFEHFHEKLRDKLISQYMATVHAPQLASIMNTMHAILELDPDTSIKQLQSRQVYVPQISTQLGEQPEEVERHMAQVSRGPSGLLARTAEGGGGAYVLDYGACYNLLLSNTIESIVEERYGCKALRIVKNLMRKKYLELSQISEHTLIPPQELNDLMSRLFRESMVSLQEVPRIEEYNPSKTFYLYSFDTESVRRILLDRAFQIIGNMLVKRRSVAEEASYVLRKEERVSELLAEERGAATEERLSEIEQVLTPGEKTQARNSRMMLERLEIAELFIDESIFILSRFHTFP